ncbi:MAG: hypothetical protein WCG47_01935 [Dermatophilaceae bacterium]
MSTSIEPIISRIRTEVEQQRGQQPRRVVQQQQQDGRRTLEQGDTAIAAPGEKAAMTTGRRLRLHRRR